MPKLARNQASDCDYPELDIYTQVSGVGFVDVFSLEYVIKEDVTSPGSPVQVYPPAGRATVNLALCPAGEKLSTGHYVALYTPDLTEPIGTHIIEWYFKLSATSPEQTFCEDFEVLAEGSASSSTGYCTIAELRALGIPDTGTNAKSNAELQTLITLASNMIDRYTGRFFEPRSQVINVDGKGRNGLLLGDPIIKINSITLRSDDFTSDQPIDLGDVRIYNRHLTQNLTNPDDRDSPKIEFIEFDRRYERNNVSGNSAHYIFHPHRWPDGTQNVEIDGVFGYTEYDQTEYGRTPFLISRATCLIVTRQLLYSAYSQADKANDAANWWRVTEMKTRDQSIKYADPSKFGRSRAGVGAFTGDPEIDAIIASFRRPPMMAGV